MNEGVTGDMSATFFSYPMEPDSVMPHASPMILIDQIDACDAESISASMTVRDDSPFVENGRVPSYIAVEYMAQTIAAYSGIDGRQKDEPVRIGFLLGTRKMTLNVPSFQVGDQLSLHGTVLYNDDGMASFDCTTTRDGETMASAIINVYQPDDPGELIGQGAEKPSGTRET